MAVRQWNSESQQDARHASSFEIVLSGPEGPSSSFFFQVFYLKLYCFTEHEFLQSSNKSSSVDASTVQRSRSGRPATESLQEEDAYLINDRSGFVG